MLQKQEATQTWKIDLHSHTVGSDGRNTAEEMYAAARGRGLDFFSITDHNTVRTVQEFSGELRRREENGPTLVPGFELSLQQGHFLIHGVSYEAIRQRLEKTGLEGAGTAVKIKDAELHDWLRWAVDQGGSVTVAHPGIPFGFMSTPLMKVAELHSKGLVHGSEQHNSQLERQFTSFFYNLWHQRVAQALCALGVPSYSFSDSHRQERVAARHSLVTPVDGEKDVVSVLRNAPLAVEHAKNGVR